MTIFLQIDAHDEECFYDRVKSGTKMGLIFEVAEGGALDIDVNISGIVSRSVRIKDIETIGFLKPK